MVSIMGRRSPRLLNVQKELLWKRMEGRGLVKSNWARVGQVHGNDSPSYPPP